VRDLLRAFTDLAETVITLDAMHTQTDTAALITGRRAHYVMTVKANMPTLYRRLKKLPWAGIPATSTVTTDHGRRARRTIKVAQVPAWIECEAATQVAQLRRTVTRDGKKTVGWEEDRRGRLPDHQRRPAQRHTHHARFVGPEPLAHREQTVRHEAPRRIPGSAGRNSEGGFWVNIHVP
jgi:hypothetical protein